MHPFLLAITVFAFSFGIVSPGVAQAQADLEESSAATTEPAPESAVDMAPQETSTPEANSTGSDAVSSSSASESPNEYPNAAENSSDLDFGDFGDFGDLDLAALLNVDVESASSKVASIQDAPAVIEVVTAKEIRDWGASTLTEVLTRLVAVELYESYLGAYNLSVRGPARDHWDNKTLILVDGLPLFEAGNMGAIHNQVPINAIERIEFIRGPGGVMFGTNAISGVINIITRRAEASEGSVYASGSYSVDSGRTTKLDALDRLSEEVRASGSFVKGKFRFDVDAQQLREGQWRSFVPETSVLDANGVARSHEYSRGTSIANVSVRTGMVTEDQELLLKGAFRNQQRLSWGFRPVPDIANTPAVSNSGFAQLSYKKKFASASLQASVAYIHDKLDKRIGMYPAPLDPDFEFGGRVGTARTLYWDVDTSRLDTTIKSSIDLGEKLHFTIGASNSLYFYRSYNVRFADGPNGEDGDLMPTMPPVNYSNGAWDTNIMSELTWTVNENLSLLAGVRVASFVPPDLRPDLEPPETAITPNPRLAAIIGAGERAKIKLLYGTAFRLPSLFELYAEAFGVIGPNPDLVPETINTFEIAYDVRPKDNINFAVNLFVNRTAQEITNERVFVGGSEQFVHFNTKGSLYYGSELVLRYVGDWVDAKFAGGFIDGKDNWELGVGGVDQQVVARYQLSANATFELVEDSLFLTGLYRFYSSRNDFDAINELNVTSRYVINDSFNIGVELENLTNVQYAVPDRLLETAPQGVFQNRPFTSTLVLEATF